MPSETEKKIVNRAVAHGGKPPKGVRRVAALPLGVSGMAARGARNVSINGKPTTK